MIADLDPVLPRELLELAHRSAKLYPRFVSELTSESQHNIDLRDAGSLPSKSIRLRRATAFAPSPPQQALALEPKLAIPPDPAYTMRERAVDPRDLVAALLSGSAKTQGRNHYRRGRQQNSGGARASQRSAHRSSFLRRAASRELRGSMGPSDRRRQVADPAGERTHGGAGFSRGVGDELPRARTEARTAPRPALAVVLHHSAQQWTLRCGQHG